MGRGVSQVAKGHFADLLILSYPNSPNRLIMYQPKDMRIEKEICGDKCQMQKIDICFIEC